MKGTILGLCLLLMSVQCSNAQSKRDSSSKMNSTSAEREIINLSKQKWLWMTDRKVDSLTTLFKEKAVFVHMGGSSNKERELAVIKVQYKHADIFETSVQFIENTSILLSRIRLLAVVGGNEVTNPFTVTEVYVKQNSKCSLGSLSFTRMLGD